MAYETLSTAVQDFWRARRQAGLQQLMSRFTGAPTDLLSYEEVRRKLRAQNMRPAGLQTIPLDAIIGSVGRYRDFTRGFMPLQDSDSQRWASVKVAQSNAGTPPIEVYRIGEAYFVLDGNHRVSIARQQGLTTIEAFVTDVQSKVPLSPTDDIDDIIIKAEYAEFLSTTRLDELRPQADLILTAAGKYPLLLEQIEFHRYYMGLDRKRDISYTEAVEDWYDKIYLPMLQLISDKGLMHDFPERTPADLYVWLAEHRAELAARLGWEVNPTLAVADLKESADLGVFADTLSQPVARGVASLLRPGNASTPRRQEIEHHRRWRRAYLEAQLAESNPLVGVILVPVRGQDSDWHALDQAIVIAKREGSLIRGLYTVADEKGREALATKSLRTEFKNICKLHHVDGELIVEVGDLDVICQRRARWADLTVVRLPSAEIQTSGTTSSYRQLLRDIESPMLLVPASFSNLTSVLLAYDGDDHTDASLFAAAYVASHWRINLFVVGTAVDDDANQAALEKATNYLQSRQISAEYIRGSGDATHTILELVEQHKLDFIIMGSAGFTSVAANSPVPILLTH